MSRDGASFPISGKSSGKYFVRVVHVPAANLGVSFPECAAVAPRPPIADDQDDPNTREVDAGTLRGDRDALQRSNGRRIKKTAAVIWIDGGRDEAALAAHQHEMLPWACATAKYASHAPDDGSPTALPTRSSPSDSVAHSERTRD